MENNYFLTSDNVDEPKTIEFVWREGYQISAKVDNRTATVLKVKAGNDVLGEVYY